MRARPAVAALCAAAATALLVACTRSTAPTPASPSPRPQPVPEACAIGLTASSSTLGVGGGDVSLDVTTGAACRWTLTTDATWMQADTASGTGPARVRLSTAANAGLDDRRGRVQLNEASVEFVQRGQASCQHQLSTTEAFAFPEGGRDQFSIATEPGCAWTASSRDARVTILEGASGSGAGTIRYAVEPAAGQGNTNDFITVPIEVRWAGPTQGENMRVRQFPDCLAAFVYGPETPHTGAVFMPPRPLEIGADGAANLHLIVQTEPFMGCPWTASAPTVDWIHFDRWFPVFPAFGRGDTDVRITVDPNPSHAARTTQVVLRPRVVTITQAGRP